MPPVPSPRPAEPRPSASPLLQGAACSPLPPWWRQTQSGALPRTAGVAPPEPVGPAASRASGARAGPSTYCSEGRWPASALELSERHRHGFTKQCLSVSSPSSEPRVGVPALQQSDAFSNQRTNALPLKPSFLHKFHISCRNLHAGGRGDGAHSTARTLNQHPTRVEVPHFAACIPRRHPDLREAALDRHVVVCPRPSRLCRVQAVCRASQSLFVPVRLLVHVARDPDAVDDALPEDALHGPNLRARA